MSSLAFPVDVVVEVGEVAEVAEEAEVEAEVEVAVVEAVAVDQVLGAVAATIRTTAVAAAADRYVAVEVDAVVEEEVLDPTVF